VATSIASVCEHRCSERILHGYADPDRCAVLKCKSAVVLRGMADLSPAEGTAL
jgi:hypothetical protein